MDACVTSDGEKKSRTSDEVRRMCWMWWRRTKGGTSAWTRFLPLHPNVNSNAGEWRPARCVALTFDSVAVTLGWVTRQGMTSGCVSFMYNTSGLIASCSTNGCWLSETETLRSGTHTAQRIIMDNKSFNWTLGQVQI